MKDRVILDLCCGTGAWSKPYRDAGYDVRLVTLPEQDVLTYRFDGQPHGILAAPPCTHFSFARTRAKTPRDFRVAMTIVAACLKIVWDCQPQWWVLENPVGYLRRFLGKPAFTFKPCEFGDPWAKRTDLWGYFKLPRKLKQPVLVPKGQHRASAWHDLGGNRAERRAITPPGFARAFFEANP